MRLDRPRLARTTSRVTGPGIPSVYPDSEEVCASGELARSSLSWVPLLPEINWTKEGKRQGLH